jgi:DTW domain-containing protein YfiP
MVDETPGPTRDACPHCGKPASLCICSDIVPLESRVEVVILQHPQEQDVALGTARLTALHLKQATLRIGLSWPSLAKLLGRSVDPKRWAVLYLGSARPAEIAAGRELLLLDRKGEPLVDQARALAEIDGVVLLDGSWSQAKALWWRNPWMLKCRRIVLAPRWPSRYGKLRREPRREGLSTIEAAALLLSRLEERPDIEAALVHSLERLLARYRAGRRAPAQRESASTSGRSSAA